MSPPITYTLPAMHLICNLVILDIPGNNITNSGPNHWYQPPQHQFSTLSDGYVIYPDIGAAYKIYNDSVSWIDARNRCSREGAQLALIDSDMKMKYAISQRQAPGSMHVGIIRMYDDSMWVSVSTGLPVSSIPWAYDEPWGDQDCVMISGDGRGLVNHSCDVKSEFICEIPIRENIPLEMH